MVCNYCTAVRIAGLETASQPESRTLRVWNKTQGLHDLKVQWLHRAMYHRVSRRLRIHPTWSPTGSKSDQRDAGIPTLGHAEAAAGSVMMQWQGTAPQTTTANNFVLHTNT